jgi:hypothetical protein
MLDGTEFFECQCGADEHTLRMILDLDPMDPCIYTTVYMNPYLPWYRRAWIGIKYMLGEPWRTGAFTEFMMRPEDVPRIRALLDQLEAARAIPRSERMATNRGST